MDGDVLGLERRRRWSDERKREIVLASFAPGILVKDVARRHDVSTSLVFAWRRQARNGIVARMPVDTVMVAKLSR